MQHSDRACAWHVRKMCQNPWDFCQVMISPIPCDQVLPLRPLTPPFLGCPLETAGNLQTAGHFLFFRRGRSQRCAMGSAFPILCSNLPPPFMPTPRSRSSESLLLSPTSSCLFLQRLLQYSAPLSRIVRDVHEHDSRISGLQPSDCGHIIVV